MRGTCARISQAKHRRGIIPAGAGHLGIFRGVVASTGDHPRRCGALEKNRGTRKRRLGSSPQVRGTSSYRSLTRFRRGIIPAGAGHFQSIPSRGYSSRDHPRRCGALPIARRSAATARGSSPQVRGTWAWRAQNRKNRGIIPAGAGHLAATTPP